MSIKIRVAQTTERDALEALQRRASLSNPNDREALLAHPDAIALPAEQIVAGQAFVAQRGNAVLGFAALELRADGEMELDGLFVEPSCWREGIGRALVEHCCSFAKSRGATALHVVGNPVCTENLNPGVVVMESAEDGERFDTPGPLNRARDRRIFIQ